MLLYQLFKLPARTSLWFFYKRIYRLYRERQPLREPTIIVANHANTFTDPISIALLQRRDLYFWARANEFKKPVVGWVARNVHMLPIHRMRDGKDQMAKNAETFAASRRVLAQTGNMLFIAPEGDCYVEKRLRTLKQGTARLALEFLNENKGSELYIQPLGLNYTNITGGWGDFFLVWGEPIDVRRYWADFEQDEQKAVEILTQDIAEALKKVMLHIDAPENEKMVEGFWQLYRNDAAERAFPTYSYAPQRFENERAIAIGVQSAPHLEVLRPAMESYLYSLENEKLTDLGVVESQRGQAGRWAFVGLSSPIGILAFLANFLPLRLVQYLLFRIVKDDSFRAPMALVFGIVLWAVWGAVGAMVAMFLGLGWYSLFVPFLLLILQYFSQHWVEQVGILRQISRYRAFKNRKGAEAEKIELARKILQAGYRRFLQKT